MLESTFIFALLSMMMLGGVGLASRMQHLAQANKFVEQYVQEGVVSSMALERDVVSGEYRFNIKENELTQYVDRMAELAEDEIEQFLGERFSASQYRIEAGYVVYPINTRTGQGTGGIARIGCAFKSEAFAQVGGDCEGIQGVFDAYYSTTMAAGSERTILALPHLRSGVVGSEQRYLPFATLIGLRVVWNLNDGISAFTSDLLGLDRAISSQKIAVLRDEVEI